MSGSRGAVLLGAAALLLTAWAAGLFFTRMGRRVMIGVLAGAILSATLFPEAIFGVQSRFENREETSGRLLAVFEVVPIVSLMAYDYPMAGIGTGMQQNARIPMGIPRIADGLRLPDGGYRDRHAAKRAHSDGYSVRVLLRG
jgi:hypothetical protein